MGCTDTRTHTLPLRPASPTMGFAARLAVILLALFVGGCNLLPEVKDEYAGLNAERLYRLGKDAMAEGNYSRAVKIFETLEARFPYGRYAQQAILESAYSNYRIAEAAAAVAACDRFIRTYPNHPNVDYAYYLKGLVNFREDQGLMGYVYELDLSEREPKGMRESFSAFKELVAKFPDSRYTEDAQARMRYLTNSLSLYEVKVAQYYFNRGAYVAAINRAQLSLIQYPRTPANQQALELLMKSYEQLGLPQLRDDTQAILQKTFPEYLADAPKKPWWQFW